MEPNPENSAPRRVEAYLDQVLAPLTRHLSVFHQQELRRELRAHLWERVDAYRELGQSEEDAVTEALQQFGGAEDFARQWRREWSRNPDPLTLREVYDAGKMALRPTLLGLAAAMLPFVLLAWAYNSPYASQVGNAMDKHGAELEDCMTAFALLILPVLVGARQGWRKSKRAGLGVMAALTAVLVTAGFVDQIVGWLLPSGSIVESEFVVLLPLLAVWMPVACGSAALSGWWTRKAKSRRLA